MGKKELIINILREVYRILFPVIGKEDNIPETPKELRVTVRKPLSEYFKVQLARRIESVIMQLNCVPGKIYPQNRYQGGYILERIDENHNNLPLPPADLRAGYAPNDDKAFLSSGQSNIMAMKDILAEDSFPFHEGQRILEFGCASARLLRWLREYADNSELWGVDVDANLINWCQIHLSPPFNFVLTTSAPHLPFEDNHFDLIFAGSVFTHIGELADAWLLELRRICKPGGRLYITILDKTGIDYILSKRTDSEQYVLLNDFDKKTNVLSSNYNMFVFKASPKSTRVVYDREYFLKKTSGWFDVKSVNEHAYGWQTGILYETRQ